MKNKLKIAPIILQTIMIVIMAFGVFNFALKPIISSLLVVSGDDSGFEEILIDFDLEEEEREDNEEDDNEIRKEKISKASRSVGAYSASSNLVRYLKCRESFCKRYSLEVPVPPPDLHS